MALITKYVIILKNYSATISIIFIKKYQLNDTKAIFQKRKINMAFLYRQSSSNYPALYEYLGSDALNPF